MTPRVVLLAGGTGGAILACGLAELLGSSLTVITNTADDAEFWGLHVSPDTDSVLYRLAGLFNTTSGWGVREETFAALSMLRRYGEDTWFGLGDQDLATHLLRTRALRTGASLSEATDQLRQRLGIAASVLPMSDDPVRTMFTTEAGRMEFQEYYVRAHCAPALRAVEFVGADTARPAPCAVRALAEAELVVIGPSNPLVSINPILAVLGTAVDPDRTVAVSPVVAGEALKGPTLQMLTQLGHQPDAVGVARIYAGRARHFLLDQRDVGAAAEVAALGFEVTTADTVMSEPAGATALAGRLLAFAARA